jgi:hypothetical protein
MSQSKYNNIQLINEIDTLQSEIESLSLENKEETKSNIDKLPITLPNVISKKQSKCSVCNQIGHNKINKKCPLYNKKNTEITNHGLDDIKSNINEVSEEEIKNQLSEYLKTIWEIEQKNIDLEEKNKNVPLVLQRSIAGYGEYITSILFPNSIGGGSKGGMAYDNIELTDGKIVKAREVKTLSYIQTKECKTCNNKCPYFQTKCSYCNKTDFKFYRDTRFGIDTKAHIEYGNIISEYILITLDIINKTKFEVKIYKIDTKNEYFTNYLKSQYENSTKSKTCNLLAYSYDFYLSGPILLANLSIHNNNINYEYFKLTNTLIDKIPIKIFKKEELEENNIDKNLEYIEYDNYIEKFKLRKKNYNKNRGTITR